MANLSCFCCGNVFTEWDCVTCDGCQRTTHRETCGDYQLVERKGEKIAYFFCILCMEEENVQDLEDDEWGPQ